MARKTIDIGVIGNDGTGDSIRDSFRKVNDNFRELYSSLGLGDRLTFIGLSDTPASYSGQYDPVTNNTPLVTINDTESGVTFKKLVAGEGIDIRFTKDGDLEGPDQIIVSTDFESIVEDETPQLGGPLITSNGSKRYPIGDLPDIRSFTEIKNAMSEIAVIYGETYKGTEDRLAVNKGYADSKISRAGVNAINPTTGLVDSSFGRMSGPLILSRSPEPDDDELYGGLVAATKQYVDNAAFGSVANLFVATSGQDDRPGLSRALQGRALAYAYRTIEAACSRAEELILESRDEIGPYKKVLTYNNGTENCTLADIVESPLSGGQVSLGQTPFAGAVRMSVDTAEIINVGANYYPGEIITVVGGTGSSATIEVLTTLTTPGAISSFRIVSTGSYTVLPASAPATTTITGPAAPPDVLTTGRGGATFNLTYKVNSVFISNGGTGYSLVSVRITGGGGSGAFGTAVVSDGAVSSITITDQGSGFTSIPTLTVDLPRFAIKTEGFRTDFTGNVESNDEEAIRSRDIREGLFLRGETSGALAQILSHSGELDIAGNELFDVDIKFGAFLEDEVISYGDVTKNLQITILVESGIYEENLPIKVPQNTSIVGDEFRRCIIRPRPGTSSSPWAFGKFRRDLTIGTGETVQPSFDPITNTWTAVETTGDLLVIADRLYGYHYLKDSSKPVFPKINNKGAYRAAAALLDLNRTFVQEEIIAWMEDNISTATVGSVWYQFIYNKNLCKRDVGLIVDALVFDLRWGDYNRTVAAGLKYYQSTSAKVAITTQLAQYLLVITRLEELLQDIINNEEIADLSQDLFFQIIDPAFQSEAGSGTVISELIDVLKEIMDGIINIEDPTKTVNLPKNNDEMDVFLANDACRWQAITCQGHGGFMLVLDPTGQVLAKSPYAQECASFSRSTGRQTFAGGKFVDGFAGNLQFLHETTVTGTSNTRLTVSGLDRFPNLPASFLVDDSVYRINYVRDFVYNPAGSTATFVLDETTPFPRTAGAQVCTISNGDPAIITKEDHRLQAGATVKFTVSGGGSLPAGIVAGQEYYVTGAGITNNTFQITDTFGSIMPVATTSAGSGTFSYQRIYELLMPGNRSMLSNDFTQINDLGYGLVAQNGGLIEAVSMFTYYCHISYYSVNGGQIRSVGGSSAHGNYALVAEGADPLEVPTPTDVFEDLAQAVTCYAPPSFTNAAGDLSLFIYKYDYLPLNNSELEVNHIVSGAGNIYRYTVTSVTTQGIDPDPATGLPVARINLGAGVGGTEGLFRAIADGTKMTIRQNSQTLLTGGLVNVAVRPSTGLKLRETESTVYRVLQFSNYTDTNGPYEVNITNSSPAVITVLAEIKSITDNVCTTTQNHKLKLGDIFKPLVSANGLIADTEYFVTDIPEYNQFTLSVIEGGASPTLTNGTGLSIKGVKSHRLLENYTVKFNTPTAIFSATISGTTLTVDSVASGTIFAGMILSGVGITEGTVIVSGSGSTWTLDETHTIASAINMTATGTLPSPLVGGTTYFVIPNGLTNTEFAVSTDKNGNPINTTSGGLGIASYEIVGLTRTNLRENYDYIDLTLLQPGEFISDTPTGNTCTISIADPAVVTLVDHGFEAGDVIKFTTTGRLPAGMTESLNYHVLGGVTLTDDTFTFSAEPNSTPIAATGSQDGTQKVGLVRGRAGDSNFAVVPVGTLASPRINGSRFVWLGEEYTIENYEPESVTLEPYARINLNRPLVDSIINFGSSYTIKAAVPTRSNGSNGNLTIRISLTRVTSHDLLEIGTGSYADTNYPNEIYGPSVNGINESQETEERDVGRVFYVTTDQFGNFSVGPYFRVDQGTGTVTFASSIALSNLDGIGFKRGVPVSEFSTDSSFSDNAIDTVPTENAARVYIERRLGLTHTGAEVTQSQLIPANTGGFLALNGSLAMKGSINMANFRVTAMGNPTSPQDAVNLRSLTWDNLQDFTPNNVEASDIVVFTGNQNDAVNASVVGDITFNLRPGVDSALNQIDVQINPDTIINADIKSDAAIAQSKLDMTKATVRVNASGIVQADLGLASFKSTEFTVTDGWVELQTSTSISTGVTLDKIQRINGNTVVGNSTGGVANTTAVPFTTVVNDGLAIKKLQYSSTGFLRRNNLADTQDTSWSIQEASSTYTDPTDNGKIITRTGTSGIAGGGDFGARDATLRRTILSSGGGSGSDNLATTSNVALAAWDTTIGDNAGYNRLYGFKSKGGVLVFSGNNPDQNKTAYWNNAHFFVEQNGINPAPIDCSVVRTTTLSTGSNTTTGTIIGRWTLNGDPSTDGSRLQATYSADLAEFYEGDKTYEVGTVLVFGGDKEVTTSTKRADNRVAGVVSNTAAFVMYDACPGEKNLLALQGRVPVKVVGKIRKGDMLVTSGIAGVAVAGGDDVKVGTVIGKALVDYDSDHIGTIEVAVGRT